MLLEDEGTVLHEDDGRLYEVLHEDAGTVPRGGGRKPTSLP